MNTFHFRSLSFSLALAAMLGLAAAALAAEPQEAGQAATGYHGAGMMSLSPEKQAIVKKLHEDFYNSTKATRQELISKRHELDAQLYSAKPDENRIQALTKEISDLRAKLYNARISLKGKLIKEGIMLEHRGPGMGRGTGYGHGMGRGTGHDGMGKGRGGMRPCPRGGTDDCCGPR
ncbi:MAG: periplasmic heavy metal sensor [Deltaproteobacteria bacterium]|jgi:zinc resistance-associated protein|nr:periplasmic heavy metal sensor [Deltaproteobacteria bacterium]